METPFSDSDNISSNVEGLVEHIDKKLKIQDNISQLEPSWYERFKRDFGDELAQKRPSVVPWYQFYIQSMSLDSHRGINFATKLRKTIYQLMEEALSTIQDLVLDGDVDTTSYQIEREKSRSRTILSTVTTSLTNAKDNKQKDLATTQTTNETPQTYSFTLYDQNSLLQFAVLSGNLDMVKLILDEVEITSSAEQKRSQVKYIDKGDVITGFTAFHFALFTENVPIMTFLIQNGADVDKRDNYFGSPFDYARMLGRIPASNSTFTPVQQLKFWNSRSKVVEEHPISVFEEVANVHFSPYLRCDNDYIEELAFSGMTIDKTDQEFRKQYIPLIYTTSGDENLILHKIDDNVGFGVFAAREFQPGDFIVRYNGLVTSSDKVINKSYTMASGLEGVSLDGSKYRNLGGMINHSVSPNAESQCVFDRGAEQAIIVATKHIPKGHQVLINYSKNYWSKKQLKSGNLVELKNVEPLPIQ